MFPFEPYGQQTLLMSQVIQALQSSEHCLVESPTGTGKTLCLLCATLGWREAFHRLRRTTGDDPRLTEAVFGHSTLRATQVPRVYYASRTHSQLSQAMQQLKASGYSHAMASVLGSRDQLCINSHVKSKAASFVTGACRSAVKKNNCNYYPKSQDSQTVMHLSQTVSDIEELVQFGKSHSACPYYLAKGMQKQAEVIFLPYNYLIEPKQRKSLGIDLKNAVIIFDEGHNMETSCTEASSFDLAVSQLKQCSKEVDLCILVANETLVRLDAERQLKDLQILKKLICDLITALNNIEFPIDERSMHKDCEFLIDLFANLSLTHSSYSQILMIVDSCISMLSSSSYANNSKSQLQLKSFKNAIEVTFSVCTDSTTVPPANTTNDSNLVSLPNNLSRSSHFKVHIESKDISVQSTDDQGIPTSLTKADITISLWCFNSSVVMRELVQAGARSIIIASGTLSPLDGFADEMGIPFAYRLENTHVIKSYQIMVGVVHTGPNGTKLTSAFHSRDSLAYMHDLGAAITGFAATVPDGILVFFTSYSALAKTVSAWKRPFQGQNDSTWVKLQSLKHLVVEPKGKTEFADAIRLYEQKIVSGDGRGAIFFAVCRGKASEGIDFSDGKCRAVVICGIPYPAAMDPKIILKKAVLDDERRKARNCISGKDWYRQQASRAVNQAIGRVIRHRNDYGAILLCDERFSQPQSVHELPKWIRSHVKHYREYKDVPSNIEKFFETMASKTASGAFTNKPYNPLRDVTKFQNRDMSPFMIKPHTVSRMRHPLSVQYEDPLRNAARFERHANDPLRQAAIASRNTSRATISKEDDSPLTKAKQNAYKRHASDPLLAHPHVNVNDFGGTRFQSASALRIGALEAERLTNTVNSIKPAPRDQLSATPVADPLKRVKPLIQPDPVDFETYKTEMKQRMKRDRDEKQPRDPSASEVFLNTIKRVFKDEFYKKMQRILKQYKAEKIGRQQLVDDCASHFLGFSNDECCGVSLEERVRLCRELNMFIGNTSFKLLEISIKQKLLTMQK